MINEKHIEYKLIEQLTDLKYSYRPGIRNRQTLESNLRLKFEALNRVRLSDSEFTYLCYEIITAAVFNASKLLHEKDPLKGEDNTLPSV